MSRWQRTLNLNDIWDKAKKREITPQALALEISMRLKNIRPFKEYYIEDEKLEIIEELDDFSLQEDVTFNDFDYIMNRLYDWGDTPLDNKFGGNKVCWIKTIY